MMRRAWLALIVLAISLVPFSGVLAECVDVLDVRRELTYDVVTPKGKNLSYFYNLHREQYLVFLSADGGNALPHGPFVLQRNCLPGTLRWESDMFVLIERACGTFCWTVDALSTSGATQNLERPLEFDEGRNLVLFYAEQDVIGVRNLMTLEEQRIRTAGACDTTSSLCFRDARFNGNDVTYTWQDGQRFSIPLEKRLYAR